MMTILWVSTYHSWSLQNTQAGVNFIINLLCIGGTFVLVRFFWLRAAQQVIKNKDVLAYKLLSLNTVGETLDAILLLRSDILQPYFRGLLIQCIVVITLATVGVFAAFIARFSTKLGTTVITQDVPGILAQRSRGSMEWAPVELNNSFVALKHANFPQTQLLEFWPQPNGWVFNTKEWNSSWSMDCQYIRATEIADPIATGDCSNDTSSEYAQFPEFPQLLADYQDFTTPTFYIAPSFKWTSSDNYNSWDLLYTIYGIQGLAYDEKTNSTTKIEIRVRMFYLYGVPIPDYSTNTTCSIGKGPMNRAMFTGATCNLTRDRGDRSTEDLWWGANPDNSNIFYEADAIGTFFGNQWALNASAGYDIHIVQGEEMAMFYQAYQITKDTNAGRVTNTTKFEGPANATNVLSQTAPSIEDIFPIVYRELDIRVPVPQVSVPCVVICAIGFVMVLAGGVNFFAFTTFNRGRLEGAPQSKLDWMLKTLHQEASIRNATLRHKLRYSALDDTQYEGALLSSLDKDGRRDMKSMNETVTFISSPEIASPKHDRLHRYHDQI